VKYFNTIEAWRIERVGQAAPMPAGGPSAMDLGATPSAASNQTMNVISDNDESDDLPF
jgi:hypothetical protein